MAKAWSTPAPSLRSTWASAPNPHADGSRSAGAILSRTARSSVSSFSVISIGSPSAIAPCHCPQDLQRGGSRPEAIVDVHCDQAGRTRGQRGGKGRGPLLPDTVSDGRRNGDDK